MCHAVQYEWQGKTITEYFHYRYAKLPVLQRDGETRLYPWGRHQQELGHLPLGGWATQEQIYRGAWDKFTPIPVKQISKNAPTGSPSSADNLSKDWPPATKPNAAST